MKICRNIFYLILAMFASMLAREAKDTGNIALNIYWIGVTAYWSFLYFLDDLESLFKIFIEK